MAAFVEWKETTLGEVAAVDWGNTDLTKRAYDPTGAYLAVSAAGCDGRIAHAEHPIGTTVISAIGEYAGRVFYPREPFTAIKNTLTVKAKDGVADDDYLHYLLVKNTVPRRGAAQPFLSKGDTMAYPVVLPPLAEQRSIAAVLSSLDEKVELLRRQNETLEQIAQAIFNEWFVKPTVDGALPSGWQKGKLTDIAVNIRRGISAGDIGATTPYIGLEHMPRHSIALSEWAFGVELKSGKFQFKRGEILFGKLRPYFHKVGVAPIDGVCSTDVLVVAPKSKEWFGQTLCLLSSDAFIKYTTVSSEGTKMPRTDWHKMADYPILIPQREIAEEFSDRVSTAVNKISANIESMRTLAAIRDALLPRLMSGELTTSN